jgi:hypothetical protein
MLVYFMNIIIFFHAWLWNMQYKQYIGTGSQEMTQRPALTKKVVGNNIVYASHENWSVILFR